MSNRRKLRPHELARKDQALAEARNAAADPTTAVYVIDYPENGEQCSWCDCPSPFDDPASPHTVPGFRCGGCPADADKMIKAFYGTPREQAVPVCAGHMSDATGFLMRYAEGLPIGVAGGWED